jgi:CRP-like cAMP-binding protein
MNEALTELFSGMSKEQVDVLLTKGQKAFYKKGSFVHLETDLCEFLEIILEGSIIIEQWNKEGNIKLFKNYTVGDVIGLNLLFSSHPYYFMNVSTKEDTTLLKLHKEDILYFIHHSERFRQNFITALSDNSLDFGKQLTFDFKRTLRDKISHYLEEQKNLQKSKTIVLTSTKTELATYFGVERTSLSRELQKMKKDGLISYDRRQITILF